MVVGGLGARGANPSSGTFWRSGRESEPTNFWANPSPGIGAADRQSELTNFWANPSPGTGAADRQSEPANFRRPIGESEPANFRWPMDQGIFIVSRIFLEDGVSDTETNYQ